MRIHPGESGRRAVLWAGVVALAVAALALAGRTPARGETPPAGPGAPKVVLSGTYGCDVDDVQYFEPGMSEPTIFRETVDQITIASTGGVELTVPPTPGFGEFPAPGAVLSGGHGFNGGTIEYCLRFAGTIAATAREQGCVVSDVRHRPRIGSRESAALSFVCEGSVEFEQHAVGELGRALIALKLLPAP